MGVFDKLLVVELASVLAGPGVGQFMAELGARVIKVENPSTGGDTTRHWLVEGEEPPKPGCTAYFSSVNWGKESLSLDLRAKQGQEVFRKIIAKADVVLTSFKPGSAERLGMDFTSLSMLNERLIYLSITGFGEKEERAGFDAIVQAETGFMAMNGWPGQSPTKMPVALMDVLAGHQAKEGILLALLERNKTDKGKKIEVALRDAGWASLANQGTNWLQAGHEPQAMGNDHPNIVPYGTLFQDKEGQSFILAIGTDSQFAKLCELLDRQDRSTDPLYQTNAKRVANRAQVITVLQDRFNDISLQDFYPRALAVGLPIGKVNTVSASLQHPAFEKLQLTSDDGLAGIRNAIFLEEQKALTPPPALGQHSVAIIQELGYSQEEIYTLQQEGVL